MGLVPKVGHPRLLHVDAFPQLGRLAPFHTGRRLDQVGWRMISSLHRVAGHARALLYFSFQQGAGQACIRTAVHRRRRGGTPPWTPLPPPLDPPPPPLPPF